ncbi:MAG: RNA-binding S4 domain-containing protein, partial [Ramlibacter sp.]|nr:RNA-binding S4 domain-containing protein [Ramlibacter sp.]
NGAGVKPARELKRGDTVTLRQGPVTRTVVVKGLSGMRGPAPVAQQLYEETEASLTARLQAAEQRRLSPEPSHSIEHGRPTKRGRRELDDAKSWGDRWSASIDEDR